MGSNGAEISDKIVNKSSKDVKEKVESDINKLIISNIKTRVNALYKNITNNENNTTEEIMGLYSEYFNIRTAITGTKINLSLAIETSSHNIYEKTFTQDQLFENGGIFDLVNQKDLVIKKEYLKVKNSAATKNEDLTNHYKKLMENIFATKRTKNQKHNTKNKMRVEDNIYSKYTQWKMEDGTASNNYTRSLYIKRNGKYYYFNAGWVYEQLKIKGIQDGENLSSLLQDFKQDSIKGLLIGDRWDNDQKVFEQDKLGNSSFASFETLEKIVTELNGILNNSDQVIKKKLKELFLPENSKELNKAKEIIENSIDDLFKQISDSKT